MPEKSNEELSVRVEQLERIVLTLIGHLGRKGYPNDAGFLWGMDGVIDRGTEFGKAWPDAAQKMGLIPPGSSLDRPADTGSE